MTRRPSSPAWSCSRFPPPSRLHEAGSPTEALTTGGRSAAGTLGHMAPVSPAPQTGAGLLVDCLAAEGCEDVFSGPGVETMAILHAPSRPGPLQQITTP